MASGAQALPQRRLTLYCRGERLRTTSPTASEETEDREAMTAVAEEEAAMTAVAEDGTEPMASLQAESPAQWITCWGDKWGWQVSFRKPNREFKCPRWRSAVGSQAAQPHGAAHTDADAASTASYEGDGSVAGGGNNIEPAASPPLQAPRRPSFIARATLVRTCSGWPVTPSRSRSLSTATT